MSPCVDPAELAGLALLKRPQRCLGGEPAGQELGSRLKELR